MLNDNDKANLEEIGYPIFIAIGKASKRIPIDVKESNPQIDWKGLISYRNFVVHEYF